MFLYLFSVKIAQTDWYTQDLFEILFQLLWINDVVSGAFQPIRRIQSNSSGERSFRLPGNGIRHHFRLSQPRRFVWRFHRKRGFHGFLHNRSCCHSQQHSRSLGNGSRRQEILFRWAQELYFKVSRIILDIFRLLFSKSVLRKTEFIQTKSRRSHFASTRLRLLGGFSDPRGLWKRNSRNFRRRLNQTKLDARKFVTCREAREILLTAWFMS